MNHKVRRYRHRDRQPSKNGCLRIQDDISECLIIKKIAVLFSVFFAEDCLASVREKSAAQALAGSYQPGRPAEQPASKQQADTKSTRKTDVTNAKNGMAKAVN